VFLISIVYDSLKSSESLLTAFEQLIFPKFAISTFVLALEIGRIIIGLLIMISSLKIQKLVVELFKFSKCLGLPIVLVISLRMNWSDLLDSPNLLHKLLSHIRSFITNGGGKFSTNIRKFYKICKMIFNLNLPQAPFEIRNASVHIPQKPGTMSI